MRKNQQGFGHVVLFLFLVVLLAVGFAGWRVMSANKGQPKNSQSNQQTSRSSSIQEGSGPNYKALANCSSNPIFDTSPITLSDYYQIIPLGNLNVPDHAIPTDHLYFSFNHMGQTSQLKSPGRIVVASILNSGETLNGVPLTNDYQVTFFGCKGVNFNFGHVQQLTGKLANAVADKSWDKPCDRHTPAAGEETFYCTKTTDLVLQPGELIGTVGSTKVGDFDFGAHSASVQSKGFTDPSWYGGGFTTAVCGLDYFSPAVKAQLYSLIKRTQEPRCGQIGQDKSNTAQGAWFATTDPRTAMNDWNTNLSLVHNNLDRNIGELSVAGTISPPMMFVFVPAHSGTIDREPSEITANGTVYCFQDEPQAQSSYVRGGGNGKVLLQLIDNKTMKVEHQSGSCISSETLANPTTYHR